ncbi:MAG: diacylglycerol kinase [Pseudomonadales bacterium]|jgi:diacylglycerol kinase (ATP)
MNPAPSNDQAPANEQAQGFHKSSNTGFAHLRNSIRFSYKGLVAAFKYESAFRQELAVIVLLIPLGLWISDSALQFTLLMVSASFVLVIELLNSAVEAAIDRIGPEHHPLSGRAKDLGSAAVMVCLILAAAIWLVTLLEFLAIL